MAKTLRGGVTPAIDARVCVGALEMLLWVIGILAVVQIHVTDLHRDVLRDTGYLWITELLRAPGVALFFIVAGYLFAEQAVRGYGLRSFPAEKR